MMNVFLVLGGLNGMLAVIFGAYGAHGLKKKVTSDKLAAFNTGVQYHMFHAIGLILVAVLSGLLGNSMWLWWSGWAMMCGIILFPGSLYVICITGVRSLGLVTPLGGIVLLLGWLFLAIAGLNG